MKKKKEYLIVKKYVSNIWFGILLLFIGIIGVVFICHQIFSYQTLIYPHLDTFYPDFTTNNVSGLNFLAYFTIISNLLISIYFIFLALSIFGVKLFKNLVLNPSLVGAVVLYLFIVGFVYCCLLIWFITDFDWASPLAINNVICYWQHVFIPLFVFVLLYRPFTNQTIPKQCAYYYLIFPFAYLIFSLIRGAVGTSAFYAYPFFSPALLWRYLGGLAEYNNALAITYMVLILLLLLVLFYAFARFIIYTHNERVKRIFNDKTIEQKIIPDESIKTIIVEKE